MFSSFLLPSSSRAPMEKDGTYTLRPARERHKKARTGRTRTPARTLAHSRRTSQHVARLASRAVCHARHTNVPHTRAPREAYHVSRIRSLINALRIRPAVTPLSNSEARVTPRTPTTICAPLLNHNPCLTSDARLPGMDDTWTATGSAFR